ncbi:hypothetical protein [Marinilactibacillus kalidii]|uniref:hypothetical protein n=1 Tax=Marinilactibacillus kalidii TaxID=2820274 RepID=UPI001ABDCCC7|nr:hypothetical protein [Marinilactibacillus kalidii]
MKWNKWLGLLSQQKGYILLESLICLSLVTYVLLVTMPATISLLDKHENHKIKTEITRALLDHAESWQPDRPYKKTVTSYNKLINVKTTEKGIEVDSDRNQETRVVIQGVNWLP